MVLRGKSFCFRTLQFFFKSMFTIARKHAPSTRNRIHGEWHFSYTQKAGKSINRSRVGVLIGTSSLWSMIHEASYEENYSRPYYLRSEGTESGTWLQTSDWGYSRKFCHARGLPEIKHPRVSNAEHTQGFPIRVLVGFDLTENFHVARKFACLQVCPGMRQFQEHCLVTLRHITRRGWKRLWKLRRQGI